MWFFCNHNLEYLDEAKTFQMHHRTRWGQLDRSQRTIAGIVWVDQSVRFQAGQKASKKPGDQFQIFQTGVPTIETDAFWTKTTLIGDLQHLAKMIILGQTILLFVVNSIINRDIPFAIGPQQGHQIDARHHSFMFAGPMPCH